MPRVRTCPNGHQWEAADDHGALCPVCGSQPTTQSVGRTDTAPTVLHAPAWQPLPGINDHAPPRIPEYEILEEVGRGGMGVVYKARPNGTDHVVALKVIRKDRLLDEETVRRFRREAQAAARLDHPNIVRVLDSDHTGDTHFLVMEFVDGITLQRLVEQNGPLPIPRACEFVLQAATGLQHAREQGLVHRDVKPSNLMIEKDRAKPQGVDQLKILDMGVARVLQGVGGSAAESFSTLTQGGAVIGTADYIAPEQLEDPHGADIRADLYSLGCTFYYLLTGQVPFPGGSLISKLDKQRWHEPRPVAEVRTDLPAAVASVVERLMAKKPADRYQSPAELIRVLQALVRSGYTSATALLTLAEVRRVKAHATTIWSAAFSPDGKNLVTAGKDQSLLLWDTANGQLVRSFPRHAQEIRCALFAQNGQRVVSASGFTLRVWDITSGLEIRRISGHTGTVRCLAHSPGGDRLASGADDKTVRVWELQSGHEVQRYTRHTASPASLAFTPDHSHLLSGGRDQLLRLWDHRNGHDVRVLGSGFGAVLGVAVSADGGRAASAHFDTVIRLWSLPDGAELGRLEGHTQMVSAVAFAPDGRRLLSGSQDQTLRLWDLETNTELARITAHAGGVNAVGVSPDGRLAFTAGADGTFCLYRLPE